MDRQAILDRLNAEAPSLKLSYGVKSLAVFGSMARGDDREGSDVDILVSFEGKPTFDKCVRPAGTVAGMTTQRRSGGAPRREFDRVPQQPAQAHHRERGEREAD
jgi:hypothetical protein